MTGGDGEDKSSESRSAHCNDSDVDGGTAGSRIHTYTTVWTTSEPSDTLRAVLIKRSSPHTTSVNRSSTVMDVMQTAHMSVHHDGCGVRGLHDAGYFLHSFLGDRL